jgi:hypothetical protein
MQMANEHGGMPQDKDHSRQQQKPKHENEPPKPKDREQAADSSAGKAARKDNQKGQS